MQNKTLSPKEMALLIGASESSLKRWIDTGKLPAHKTRGGHRRISVPDAVDFIRTHRMSVERPDLLGLTLDPTLNGLASRENLGAVFEHYLLEGRQEESYSLILSEYLSGVSVAEVCDRYIQPALSRIGAIWAHDSYGIVLEHRATDLCLRILNQIRGILPPVPGPIRGIGCAPAGDPYVLPSLCAAVSLESIGVGVTNLGPNLPFSSILEATENLSPGFVWLSISHVENPVAFQSEFAEFCGRLGLKSLPLIVGGYGLAKVTIPENPLVWIGSSMSDLISIGDRLPSC